MKQHHFAHHRLRNRASARLPQLAVIFCAAASGAAWAQSSPYFIGASQAFTNDSNVFRVSNNRGPIRDTISATSLFGGVEQQLGRQKVFASAAIQVNSYNRLSRLDFVGSEFAAGLNWATVNRLTGAVKYSRSEGQGDFSRPEAQTQGKNVQVTQFADADVKYELTARVSVNASLEYREISVDNKAFASSEIAGEVARLGVSYEVGPKLTVGTGLRYSQDRRGNAVQVGADQFTGRKTRNRSLDFSANWQPTERIGLNGSIGFGTESQSTRNSRSSSQVTGALNGSYAPTSRLSFNASFSRDTGTETTFRAAPASVDGAPPSGPDGLFIDSNRLTTATAFGAKYALTSKVGFTAGYDRSDGSYQGFDGNDRDNIVDRYNLGVQYAALPNLIFGCGARRETRDGASNSTGLGGVQSYHTTAVSCNVRYVIR